MTQTSTVKNSERFILLSATWMHCSLLLHQLTFLCWRLGMWVTWPATIEPKMYRLFDPVFRAQVSISTAIFLHWLSVLQVVLATGHVLVRKSCFLLLHDVFRYYRHYGTSQLSANMWWYCIVLLHQLAAITLEHLQCSWHCAVPPENLFMTIQRL